VRNRKTLEGWRDEVRRVARVTPAERYLYTTLIFKQARVPGEPELLRAAARARRAGRGDPRGSGGS